MGSAAHDSPRFACVGVAISMVLASAASCLEDLPAPLPAADASASAEAAVDASACGPFDPAAPPARDCSAAVTEAMGTDPNCAMQRAATKCLLEPTGVACEDTCPAPDPACRGSCPAAVSTRAGEANCSRAQSTTLGDAPGMAACYTTRCPRAQCVAACDGRGFVVSAWKYSNFTDDVVLRTLLLDSPSAGQLGVHLRLRGYVEGTVEVRVGNEVVRRFAIPATNVVAFIDTVLFDQDPSGPYRWTEASRAPTDVRLVRGLESSVVIEVDCVTPFYLPP